jgi:hypothetical protein
VAAQLAASQEGLSSMELGSYVPASVNVVIMITTDAFTRYYGFILEK